MKKLWHFSRTTTGQHRRTFHSRCEGVAVGWDSLWSAGPAKVSCKLVAMGHQDPSETRVVPMVSVSMTAFNSAGWISRAIESVLRQNASFPIELVIGDDCSTDGTLAIAYSYREQHPETIQILERTASGNVGMQRNFYETFERCRGKYIAWLDADDYWTDSGKLTAQVELLESDPSLSVCGHFVRWVTEDGTVARERSPAMPGGRYGLREILQRNFVPSPSIMFRNGIHRELPEWYFDLAALADWPVLVWAGLSGDIFLLDRVMADYMLSDASAYMGRGSVYQDRIDVEFCEHLEGSLPPEWRRAVRSTKGKRYESMAYALRKQGDFAAAREAAVQAFCAPDAMDNLAGKTKALLVAVACELGSRIR